ncbi:MAG: CHAT domain-containing protein [Candidatus Coatesbacteria bacterium]|nr:CHAT domain-containing protein [Candidatus Coatesbacteria bacterium]
MRIRPTLPLILCCLAVNPAPAQSAVTPGADGSTAGDFPLPEFEQLTTHGAYDGSPALKTGLSLVAFVSERAGNRDIWYYDLDSGELERLTEHTAADYQPTWDPTSDTVFFVSTRDDPDGELYSVDPSIDYVRRLTEHRGRDEFPAVSPDGKWVVFSRTEEEGFRPDGAPTGPNWEFPVEPANLFRIPVNGGEAERLTSSAATQPCFSPDGAWLAYVLPGRERSALVLRRLSDGRELVLVDDGSLVAYPRWRRSGIVFTRFALDTNSDGHIDILDNGQVCHLRADQVAGVLEGRFSAAAAADRLGPDQTPYRRVTTAREWSGVADLGGVNIFYASDASGNGDIWRTTIAPPPLEGAAVDVFREAQGVTDPSRRLLALVRFVDTFHADPLWGPEGQLAYADELERRGLEHQADFEREQVARRWGSSDHARAVAAYHELAVRWQRALAYDRLPTAEKALSGDVGTAEEATPVRAAALELAAEHEAKEPAVACACLVLAADTDAALGDNTAALELYDRAAYLGGDFARRAEAQTKAARSLERLGRREEARERYLDVLLNYPAEERWQGEVQASLTALETGGVTDVERLVALERVTRDYADYPELAAYAQLQIGRELEHLGQYEEAADAYQKVVDDFPRVRFLGARALIEQAAVRRRQGKPEEGARALRTVVEDYDDLGRGELAAEAEATLRRLLLDEAAAFRAHDDPQRAEALLRQALDFEYDFPAAHRALIKLLCEDLGQRDALVEEYEAVLQQEPDSAIAQYGLGLTLTYPPNGDAGTNYALEPAQAELRRAVELRYFFPAAWYARGWAASARAERSYRNGEPDRAVGDQLEAALEYYRLALAQVDPTDDPYLQADILLALGNANYQLGNPATAYRFYLERLAAAPQNHEPAVEAHFHFNLARCARYVEDYPTALEQYDVAARIYEEIGNETRRLMCLDGQALVYFEMESWHEALNRFVAVKNLYEELAENAERDAVEAPTTAQRRTAARRALVARAKVSYPLRNIGICYYFLEDFQLSLAYLGRALEVLTLTGRESEAAGGGLLDINISAGLAGDAASATEGFDLIGEQQLIYTFAANCHRRMGDFRSAILAYRRRLELFEETSDSTDARAAAAERGKLYNQLGLLSYQVDDLRAAARYYLLSREACREAEVPRGETLALVNLSEVALNIADRLRLARLSTQAAFPAVDEPEDHDESSDLQAAARELRDDLYTLEDRVRELDDPRLYARYLNARGVLELYLAPGEDDGEERLLAAEDAFFRAQSLYEGLSDPAGLIGCEHNRGAALAALGRSEAADVLQRAYDRARLFDFDRLSWRIGYSLAVTAHEAGETVRARIYLERALADLERELTQRTQPILLSVYQAEVRALYELAVEVAAAEDDHRAALELADRSRAAYLASLFGERELELYRERDRNFYNNERQYQRDISNLLQRIARLSLDPSPEAQDELEGVRAELQRQRRSYQESVAAQLEANEIVVAFAGATTVGLERVQSLLGDEAALLVYYFAGDALWTGVLDAGGIHGARIELGRDEVRRLNTAALGGDSAALERLADALLEPHAGRLENVETLYLVPDGELWRTPWGALPLDGEILLQRHELALTSSPSELAYAHSVRNISRGEPLFIVGSTTAEGERLLVDSRLAELGGDLLTGKLSTVKLNETALARRLIEFDAPLEHSGSDPLYYGLRLGPDEADAGIFPPLEDTGGEDRLPEPAELQRSVLNLKDLLALKLDANLLLLNDYGVRFELGGDLDRGLSVLGRCVSYSGSPSVVYLPAGLDLAVREAYLATFHGRRTEHSPAAAARRAALELRDAGAPVSDWARPFVLGFAGFDEEEELAYAEEAFVLTFKSAQGFFTQAEERGDDELYLTAAVQFVKAAQMADRLGKTDERLTLLNAAVESYFRAGRLDTAVEKQEEILAEVAERPDKRLQALIRLSGLHHHRGELETALDYNEQALELLGGFGAESNPQLVDLYINLYTERALLRKRLYRYDEALEDYERAAGLAAGDERPERWAGLQLEIGNLYLTAREEPQTAAYHAAEARRVYDERGDRLGEAEALALDGLAATELRDFEQARELHRHGEVLTYMGAPSERGRSARLANRFGLAKARWHSQDYAGALTVCEAALDELREEEQLLRSRFLGVAALSHLGLLHEELAAELAAESLAEALRAGKLDPAAPAEAEAAATGRVAPDIATAYANLALVRQVTGDFAAARELMERALAVDTAIDYRAAVEGDLRRLAILAELEENLELAIEYHERYLADAAPDNPRTVMGRYDLARLYPIFDPAEAERNLTSALEGARRLERVDLYWRALHQRALRREGESYDAAVADLEAAIELVNLTWPEVRLTNLRDGLLIDPHQLFSDTITLTAQFGDVERSLAQSETYRVVLGEKQLTRADLARINPELQRNLDEVRRLSGELARAIMRQDAAVGELSTRHRELIDRISRRWPDFAGLLGRTRSPAEVQQLLRPEQAAVVYFLTEQHFFHWLITADGVEIQKRQAYAVLDNGRAFIELLENRGELDELRSLGGAVYRETLRSWERELFLETIDEVLIIPDGLLTQLPFGCLPFEEEYVIDGALLEYAPSLTAYFQPAVEDYGELPLLSIADPETAQPRLEFAVKEAESIQRRYPGSPEPFLDEEARETVFHELAPDARRLHLATHSALIPGDPLHSALLFTGSLQNTEGVDPTDDGRLTVAEVIGMDLRAEVAALSACSTAVGGQSVGRELLSLARAFLFAGTGSVLATFNRTSDITTAVLVRNFFVNLSDGLDPAAALHLAQLQTRGQFEHPSYWGAVGLFSRQGVHGGDTPQLGEEE